MKQISKLRSRRTLEVAVRRCYVKKVFLKILQNSQEYTCARVSFLAKDSGTSVFLCISRYFVRKPFFIEHLW